MFIYYFLYVEQITDIYYAHKPLDHPLTLCLLTCSYCASDVVTLQARRVSTEELPVACGKKTYTINVFNVLNG